MRHDCVCKLSKMQRYEASERNKNPILNELKLYLKDGTFFLEIASGTGQHIAYFAQYFKNITFQPTETTLDSTLIPSINEYRKYYNLENVKEAKYLDVTEDPKYWLSGSLKKDSIDYIFCSNMIHIAPFNCTEGLFRGSGMYLKPGGFLFLYGPFAYNGTISPESNVKFHQQLRDRNPLWGLRDVHQQLEAEASKYHLHLKTRHKLPSNNELLVWEKYENDECNMNKTT